ncbi:MAG: D-glycero-beta-D-manno-heptose 1,7-bisphosphate 7-phosphatase [Armatimonadetes bacterium]|nr:D-glycero-beta-D-manno-heptose 1,7-bisphosphate 7-phosphatase [Armatimonadota bacterium]
MTAVILCGGLGTRLRPVIGDLPKILAPIAGRPFLHSLLAYLRGQGITDVVLATGHGAAAVAACGGDGSARGLRLRYSEETEPLGTGGAIRLAAPQIGSDPFLVLNGDSLVGADLARTVAFHQERGARATLVLAEVPDKTRFGSVLLEPDGRVAGFVEKGASGPGRINAGIYVMNREVLQAIPAGRSVSVEREVFPALVGRGLYGLVAPGPFIDIGTPEAFAEAQRRLRIADCGLQIFPEARNLQSAICNPQSPRLVFLDRDGTLNVERYYLSSPEQVTLLPGAAEGVRRMREMGLATVVATNQSGLARGYFDAAALERVHERLRALLAEAGAAVDAIYVCPHHPDEGCDCRKPAPGMGRRAARDFGADPARAFVIGDKVCDIHFGQAIGATTLLVRTGYGAEVEASGGAGADYVVDDLREAAAVIQEELEAPSGLGMGRRRTRSHEATKPRNTQG